jgi:hypothetical protein
MTNLENMLNEKDNKRNKIKSSIARDLVREEEKYKSKVQDINCEGASALVSLEQRYSPRLTEALTKDLTHDYDIMKQRANCANLSEEQLAEIVELKDGLSRIKNKELKEIMLKNLDQEKKNLLNMPSVDELAKSITITSYITANGEGCYILTPVIDEESNKLTKELSESIIGVTKMGNVLIGGYPVYFNKTDLKHVNNFLMLNFETTHPSDVAKGLINKFSNEHIQPKSFKESNMTHRVIALDYNILKNFAGYADKPTEHESEVKVMKKKGRPFGSKNKKSIELTVSDARGFIVGPYAPQLNVEPHGLIADAKLSDYNQLKAKYEAIAEKKGHPLTRTELNWYQKELYAEIKEAEAKGVTFDFIPYKRAPWGSKKKDKKKD